MKEEKAPDSVFNELDLDTGNRLLVLVYNEDDESVSVENPHDLPFHELVGLLRVALMQCECLPFEWEYEDEDEDDG